MKVKKKKINTFNKSLGSWHQNIGRDCILKYIFYSGATNKYLQKNIFKNTKERSVIKNSHFKNKIKN